MKQVNRQGLTEAEFLARYDSTQYDRPSVSVDMLLFTVMDEEKKNYRKLPDKVLRVLLIRRSNHPYLGQWALPGGFVNVAESLDAAAQRKLHEETNISDVYLEQLYTWGDVDRDPRTRVIGVAYMALADSASLAIKANSRGEDTAWFTVTCKLRQEQKEALPAGYRVEQLFDLVLTNEQETLHAVLRKEKTVENRKVRVSREVLTSHGIAFDHAKIIEYGLQRLRNKIEYTDIAFQLMPERFSLTKLQQVYEIILDTKLLKANFRRKIADRVLETDEYVKDAGHRPSQLFTFNPNWMKILD